jgi:hypothetical protein
MVQYFRQRRQQHARRRHRCRPAHRQRRQRRVRVPCRAGEGDTVVDFVGNGGAAGDSLRFVRFGTTTGGATFTQIGATNQWQIHSGLDAHNEIITLLSGATIHSTDYLFV